MEDGLDLELELASAEPGRFVINVRSPAGDDVGSFASTPYRCCVNGHNFNPPFWPQLSPLAAPWAKSRPQCAK